MTKLSVNLNKFALVRNARGTEIPDITKIARQCIKAGAHGITVHPRCDGRHIKYEDVIALGELVKRFPSVELNVEGYPSDNFIDLINQVIPHQVTLVPDAPEQLTSDHGWHLLQHQEFLKGVIKKLNKKSRVSLFVDPDSKDLHIAQEVGAHRIELYTELYARGYKKCRSEDQLHHIIEKYQRTAMEAVKLGLSVNAGHDLSLENIKYFLDNLDVITEVSIGHALVIEAWQYGLAATIRQYLAKLS